MDHSQPPEDRSGGTAEESPAAQTTLHLRRACAGDRASLAWVVEKFTPCLLASSRYRLPAGLQHLYDPEDLVNEVWAICLPKLGALEPREGRLTPVLLKFLSTTLLHRINTLLQKHILGKPRRAHRGREEGDEEDTVSGLAEDLSGVITRLARREAAGVVSEGLAKLPSADQELFILRGIEGHPYKEIAAILGGDPKSLAVRYARVVEKLRKLLPKSIFDEVGVD